MLQVRGLHKSYVMGRSTIQVLRGVSLQTDKGEFLVIRGASGSGKSTLLHLLGALDVPDRGSVEFNGRNLFDMSDKARRAYRNHNVGFVFQFYHLLPECNVLENVLMPMMVTHSMWGWRSARRRVLRDAAEIIERVGLAERAKHRPSELSGGERQRVAIARALINRPALLLTDEPTGNLDARIGGEILKLLAELNEGGQTIVMVTHDPAMASHAHHSVLLTQGVIREIGNTGGEPSPAQLVTKEVTS